jgi:hypothetical protein
MHLTRCHDQESKTLDEFYGELSRSDEITREGGETMLALMTRLRALSDERRVYGLTSPYHLYLLAQDSAEAPRFVTITALVTRYYVVDYLMPERVAPWPGATVRGETRSEDEAVQMVLTAMEKSEGWSERR